MTLRQFQPGFALGDTTALTVGNVLDVTGVYPLNLSAGSGTRTASSVHTHSAGNTARTAVAAGQNSVMRYPFAGLASAGTVEWVFYYGGIPPNPADNVGAVGNASSVFNWSLSINSTGNLVVADTVSATIWTAAAALPAAGWYRFACKYSIATTTTGTLQCAYYADTSSTPIQLSAAFTGLNLNTTQPVFLEIGRRNLPATTAVYWHTDVQVNDGATVFGGPMSAGTNTHDEVYEVWGAAGGGLTVSLGADALFEPGAVAKLTPAIVGGYSAVAWSQEGGFTVSLVGAGVNKAYLTPALPTQQVLTFTVAVTPTGGGAAVTDTVVHTVYPQQTWLLNAGRVKVPVILGGSPIPVPDP